MVKNDDGSNLVFLVLAGWRSNFFLGMLQLKPACACHCMIKIINIGLSLFGSVHGFGIGLGCINANTLV